MREALPQRKREEPVGKARQAPGPAASRARSTILPKSASANATGSWNNGTTSRDVIG